MNRASTLASGAIMALGLVAALSAPAGAASVSPRHAAKQCSSPSSTGTAKSRYNTTPKGAGPWHVRVDPCNTEAGGGATPYYNCAYWAAEKRPDVWVDAVWKYGYTAAPGGAWDIELDAKKANLPINHHAKRGDLAVWPPNAAMGTTKAGIVHYASPGGHVAYVEKVGKHGSITISSMGIGDSPTGGYTFTMKFSKHKTFFIHHS